MVTVYKMVFAGFLLLVLASCKWMLPVEEKYFPHETDYTKSVNRPSLVVPPPLSRSQFITRYNIPPVMGDVGVSMSPPGSQLAAVDATAKKAN